MLQFPRDADCTILPWLVWRRTSPSLVNASFSPESGQWPKFRHNRSPKNWMWIPIPFAMIHCYSKRRIESIIGGPGLGAADVGLYLNLSTPPRLKTFNSTVPPPPLFACQSIHPDMHAISAIFKLLILTSLSPTFAAPAFDLEEYSPSISPRKFCGLCSCCCCESAILCNGVCAHCYSSSAEERDRNCSWLTGVNRWKRYITERRGMLMKKGSSQILLLEYMDIASFFISRNSTGQFIVLFPIYLPVRLWSWDDVFSFFVNSVNNFTELKKSHAADRWENSKVFASSFHVERFSGVSSFITNPGFKSVARLKREVRSSGSNVVRVIGVEIRGPGKCEMN